MPLNIVRQADGFPRILLTHPSGSSAEVLLYGSQVVSWKNERREELLFMSSKQTIRSCLRPPGAVYRSAFPRNRMWSVDSDPSPLPPANNQSSVNLVSKSTDEDLKIWPHSFELRLHIMLGPGKLTLIPRVRNTDNKAFSFMFALRNYLSVSDISEVRVEGLETLDYFDNLSKRDRFTEQADAITFDGKFERVYLSTPRKIAVIDHEKKRTFELWKDGMPDAVVWNPWDKKAKALPDLGDEDYQSMLCVDSAAIETRVVLKPFEEWKGRQEISAVSSSYCSGQLDPREVLYGFH
ncbi:hypothetical protein V6N13_028241 [Hibiscus sabdariffa]